MFHDILMALAGHPGEVIVESSGEGGGFAVADGCKGVSQAECSVINSIVAIGYQYRRLEDFVRSVKDGEHNYMVSLLLGDDGTYRKKCKSAKVRDSRSSNAQATGASECLPEYRGNYLSAMCTGIEEYLGAYRSHLVTVEKTILADPCLPLSTLSLIMGEQKEIIEALTYIVRLYRETVRRKVEIGRHGVLRVDEILCMLQSTGGSATLRKVRRTLYNKCLNLFKRQLKRWICRGQLSNPYDEFLVCRRRTTPDMDGSGNYRPHGDINNAFGYEHLHQHVSDKSAEFEWTFVFYLNTREPCWPICSYQAWKTILFLGKAVRMLIRRYSNENQLEAQCRHLFDDWDNVCDSAAAFEEAIEKYRIWVARAFWICVNETVDIGALIDSFRHVYFLGNHDLYDDLLERAWFTMQTPCNLASCTDVTHKVRNMMSYKFDSAPTHRTNKPVADLVNTDAAGIYGRHKANHEDAFAITQGGSGEHSQATRPIFDFRQRTYHFNMKRRRFIRCRDAAWIDNELVLNVSEKRLEEPMSRSSEASAVWFENRVHVANGFECGLRLELSQLEAAYMYSEEKMRGMTLGRFCTFALVVQCKVDPVRLSSTALDQGLPALLKDYFAVEFVVDYDNVGSDDDSILVNGAVKLVGECVSAFVGGPNVGETGTGVLCVNSGQHKFNLTDGSRKDFQFIARLKMTQKRLYAELQHLASGDSLIMETDVLDTSHLLPHEFGDAYLGLMSYSDIVANDPAKSSISKRNCAIRVSDWDYLGCMAMYDIVPLGELDSTPTHEAFHNELPGLRMLEFESGINDWIHSNMAYCCTWPVTILLDLSTMLCYNSVFQFILLIRRCVYGLENLCHLYPLMRRFGVDGKASKLPSICCRVTCMRWRMYVFMVTLQSYIQQCVVEGSCRQMRAVLEHTDTFHEIKSAHDQYLSHVAINCFLDQRSVLEPLLHCADASLKFATLFYCAFNGSSDVDYGVVVPKLGEFSAIFEHNMALVYERLLLLSNDAKYSALGTPSSVRLHASRAGARTPADPLASHQPKEGGDHHKSYDDESGLPGIHASVRRNQVALHTAGILDVHDVLEADEEERNEATERDRDANARKYTRNSLVAEQERVHRHGDDVEAQHHHNHAVPVDHPHKNERKDERYWKHDTVEVLSNGVVDVNLRERFLSECQRNAVQDEDHTEHQYLGMNDVSQESLKVPRRVVWRILLHLHLLVLLCHRRGHVRGYVPRGVVRENHHGYNQPWQMRDKQLHENKHWQVRVGHQRHDEVHDWDVEATYRQACRYDAHRHVLVRRPVTGGRVDGERHRVNRETTENARHNHERVVVWHVRQQHP
ncbi:gamma-tubulin complex component [Babesia ovata]|uniref:Gamma-tubulin complex component n=1 Tax=Babesia ovata TaxID=189622 RepID=A0A2H6KCU1_9APIC|nr:gamma-tubulin complex component [Babesia ovata]GBE60816.1 gamma-tubulin complex component [Babesia ovata]